MNIAARVMVMSDGRGAVRVAVAVRVRGLFGGHVDMGVVVVVVVRLAQRDGRPVGGVPDGVPGLRHAMQVHGRQDDDTQTDAEVAKGVRQIEAPTAV